MKFKLNELDTFSQILLASCVVALMSIGCLYFGCEYIMKKSYASWCKQTGNPRGLTLDEFRFLPEHAK